jgi:predicted Fe-Mo cluster-binding NifX family protein
MSFEAIPNSYIGRGGGTGIQSAKFVADKGAQAVLTGNCGPNAYQTLESAGIFVVTGMSGSVREALEKFKTSIFKVADCPTVAGHWGLGTTSEGSGYSNRKECGTGDGTDTGRGSLRPDRSASDVDVRQKENEELADLKEQIRQFEDKLKNLRGQINRIDNDPQD